MADAEAGSNAADAELLAKAVKAAGAVALDFMGSEPTVWDKDDGSPVSEGDLAADRKLHALLTPARPHYGYISEERCDALDIRARSFVIDPIDGTKAYLRSDPTWAVVAAVIDGGRPVAGAIFAPVSDKLFVAAKGCGATCNGSPIFQSGHCDLSGATVSMPRQLYASADLKSNGVKRGPWLPSLALRLARVAEGRIDGVVTKPGAHHWDLAAADIILEEAGGILLAAAGAPPLYDDTETSHPSIIAGPPALAQELRARLLSPATEQFG